MANKLIDGFSDILNEKVFQISVLSGILFYILAEPKVFEFVEENIKKLGSMVNIPINLEGHNLLIFHSIVFAALMGLSVKYVFEPLFYANNGLFK
jgi:hypothetical protein|tara:strand:- start:1087 stop:1371 length:285 start_codon:yes stop_codon:yes gene_type:complete